MFKFIFGSITSLFLLVTGYFILMYFFFKPPGAIIEYEFPSMSYEKLEARISKITDSKIT